MDVTVQQAVAEFLDTPTPDAWVTEARNRIPEMLLRYRARNFPESLSQEEQAQWEEFRFAWLTDPEAGASITMEDFQTQIEALQADPELATDKRKILEDLLEYGDSLLS